MSERGVNRWGTDSRELYAETTRVARQHGCARGTFSVCWAEYELGVECKCRADAMANLKATAGKVVASS